MFDFTRKSSFLKKKISDACHWFQFNLILPWMAEKNFEIIFPQKIFSYIKENVWLKEINMFLSNFSPKFSSTSCNSVQCLNLWKKSNKFLFMQFCAKIDLSFAVKIQKNEITKFFFPSHFQTKFFSKRYFFERSIKEKNWGIKFKGLGHLYYFQFFTFIHNVMFSSKDQTCYSKFIFAGSTIL